MSKMINFTIFFPCPLIIDQPNRKSQFCAKKICPLIKYPLFRKCILVPAKDFCLLFRSCPLIGMSVN